jgi:hypothetical protein
MKRQTGWQNYVVYALSAIAISVAATACGNKDGGGGAVAVVPGVGATCATCSATLSKVIASGTTRSIDYNGAEQAEMSLNFYGDTNVADTGYGYQGQVGASGILRVRVAKLAPCSVPVGDYTITTTMPGQWSGQSFGNLQVQATGPVVLRFDLPVGLIQATTPAATDWAGATFPYLVKTRAYVTLISTGGSCNAGGYPEYYFED